MVHLFLSVWTHGFLFYSIGFSTLLLLLVIYMLDFSHVWPLGAPSSWLLCPFDMSPPFFEHFLNFLAWSASGSSMLSLTQTWSQPFLQGALAPFSGEWCLETKVSHKVCLLLLGHHYSQTFPVDRTKDCIYVYIETHLCLYYFCI